MASNPRRAGSTAAVASLGAGLVGLVSCLGVMATQPADAFWINDCGNKALVSEGLLASNYHELAFDHPAAAVDPAGTTFPIVSPFAVVRDGNRFSVYPPAYAALAAPFLRAFGPNGLRLPAALGVGLAAAMACFWLSSAVGSAWAFGAGVVLALATPLFFYGMTLWEHSLTVALGLAAWILASRPRPTHLVAAGALIGVACWFRVELGLMGLALALAALLVWRRMAPLAWLAAGAAAPVLAWLLANSALYGSLLGPHLAAASGAGAAASGLPGESSVGPLQIIGGLLGSYGRGAAEAQLLGAAALAAPGFGWWVARRPRAASAGFAALCCVALGAWSLGIVGIHFAARPLETLARLNGLLVQLPLFALAGFGAERVFRDPSFASVRIGALAGLVFLVLAVAAGAGSGSGYGVQAGMGVHWGPRVLLPAFPALVAFAVAAAAPGANGSRARGVRTRRVFAALLGIAGLASSAEAAHLLRAQKTDARDFQALLLAQPSRYVLTTHPLLAQHLAPLWWRRPMMLARDPQSLESAVAALRQAGERDFSFVAPAGAPPLRSRLGLHCAVVERPRGSHVHYFDLDIQACSLDRRPRSRRNGGAGPLERRRPASE